MMCSLQMSQGFVLNGGMAGRGFGEGGGERFAQNCVMERSRYGGGSVMVWGGI